MHDGIQSYGSHWCFHKIVYTSASLHLAGYGLFGRLHLLLFFTFSLFCLGFLAWRWERDMEWLGKNVCLRWG